QLITQLLQSPPEGFAAFLIMHDGIHYLKHMMAPILGEGS
ncbi:hypothetical protein AAKU58_004394, partial [Oxalobacteraceae bacterium GrIS 1.18]